ncbi:MAG: type II toxin-antitoxin system PemK/MazF family toxin [Eubacterium sp.]|nr:type II toxin-antitoxin system PemK/MazF family toxin [Eubacterium sp.]
MDYNSLNNLNDSDKSSITSVFQGVLTSLKHVSVNKAITYLRYIPEQCRMHYSSINNRRIRDAHPKKFHPVKPLRGEIYNAFITEGVGSELCGNHLVVIIQNKKGNIYSEKVNVLPIEGNGEKINPNYQIRLSNQELSSGKLDKDPSRIIVTDVMTIDKARLGRKIGSLTPECIAAVDNLLRKHLDL